MTPQAEMQRAQFAVWLAMKPERELLGQMFVRLVTLVPALAVPQVGTFEDEDETCWELVWDTSGRGEHHLELEVHADGRLEWFYRNRVTDEVERVEALIADAIEPKLVEWLQLFAEAEV